MSRDIDIILRVFMKIFIYENFEGFYWENDHNQGAHVKISPFFSFSLGEKH